jgi:hypothetical protein
MKRILLMTLLLASLAIAQSGPSLGVSAPATRPGQTATVSINLAGSAGQNIAASEWSFTVPSGATVTAGPAATAAQKTVQCGANAQQTTTCVLYGVNSNTLADGVVATVAVPVAPISPFTSANTTGPSFTLTNTLSASLAGSAVATAAGPAVNIPLLSPCDLNGDGATNALDVVAAVSQVVSGVGSLKSLSSGSTFGLVDIQRVVNAAVSGSCVNQ